MFKEKLHIVLSCQYLPEKVRDFLPWDTESYVKGADGKVKKRQPLPICRHCGLCLTGGTCPLLEKK